MGRFDVGGGRSMVFDVARSIGRLITTGALVVEPRS